MSELYSKLDVAKQEIRLITLQPGEWADDIQCDLSIVSLVDKPSYEVSAEVVLSDSV